MTKTLALIVAAVAVLAIPAVASAGPPPTHDRLCSHGASPKPQITYLSIHGGTCSSARKVASMVRSGDGWAYALRDWDITGKGRAFDYVAYPTGGYRSDGYPNERKFRCDYWTFGSISHATGYPSKVLADCATTSGPRMAVRVMLNAAGS